MLNAAFDAFTEVKTDYYPAALRAEIDEINALRLRQREQRRLSRGLRAHAGRL